MVVRRQLWGVAWPLMLSSLTQPLLGLVDTALLGHLPGAHYMGAAALGGALLSLVFWGFGFLRMGTTSLVARDLGAAQQKAANRHLSMNLTLAVALALLLWLLAPWTLTGAVRMMGASRDVAGLATDYIYIRLVAAPATLVNYVLLGWFIAHQDSRTALRVALLTQACNIGLDLVFIQLLDLRSNGAALASTLSEYLALGAYIRHLLRKDPDFRWNKPREWQDLRALLTLNTDLLIRTYCLLGSLLFFTSQGAQQGDVLLAANAILMQWIHIAAYGLDGLAHATESLVGQWHGAQQAAKKRQTLAWAMTDSLLLALALSALLWLGQKPILFLFTDLQPVIEASEQYLIWALLIPPLSVPAYVFDGYALGIGAGRAMRNTMLLACTLVFFPTWVAFQFWGNHGLWLAFGLFNGARGLLMWHWLKRSWAINSPQVRSTRY